MKKIMKSIRKTLGDIIFAAVFATIIGALFMKSYAIPTPSMEGTLLVGDHMFVSKFHYGARLPQTPLQIPLSHQKIWGTEIPAYLEWIELPYFRLPGLEEVENNDIVVFNYPGELGQHPVDLRTFYVKRCVGIPGDTISIDQGRVYINGKALPNRGKQQHSYLMVTENVVREKFFLNNGVNDFYRVNGGYLIHADKATAQKIGKLDFVKELKPLEYTDPNHNENLSGDMNHQWSIDQYGPLYIPQKDDIIELTKENIARYKDLILYYEWNEKAEFRDGKIFLEGKKANYYTFHQNYYFMMGDNRHNSLDSRSWGLVPEDHIVGKPLFVYWSVKKSDNIIDYFSGIRWERLFKGVANS